MEREALKLALEALESGVKTTANRISWTESDTCLMNDAITAIKEALAQPAQEPIAWRWGNKKRNGGYEWRYTTYKTQPDAIPLYTTPPQREWVGLTEKDWNACEFLNTHYGKCRAIEAKLREKNHG